MSLRIVVLCATAAVTSAAGCAARPPSATPAAAPSADAPTDVVETRQSPYHSPSDASAQTHYTRYTRQRTVAVGKTIDVGPSGYARVTLLEVAPDGRSARFEVIHLIDQRRGWVGVGESFNAFTPVFGRSGAVLESAASSGATVRFHWSQPAGTPVPPGAVPERGEPSR